jgi:hypothetical protein
MEKILVSDKPQHPTYSVWEVWNGEPEPKQRSKYETDTYHCFGTFEGYLDDIALQVIALTWGRDPVRYVREVPAATRRDELVVTEKAEDSTLMLLRVELKDGTRLEGPDGQPASISAFFKGRPVVADHHPWGIRLSYHASECGQTHLEAQQRLESVLSKLTEADIEVLVRQGLQRYSYHADFYDFY